MQTLHPFFVGVERLVSLEAQLCPTIEDMEERTSRPILKGFRFPFVEGPVWTVWTGYL